MDRGRATAEHMGWQRITGRRKESLQGTDSTQDVGALTVRGEHQKGRGAARSLVS